MQYSDSNLTTHPSAYYKCCLRCPEVLSVTLSVDRHPLNTLVSMHQVAYELETFLAGDVRIVQRGGASGP